MSGIGEMDFSLAVIDFAAWALNVMMFLKVLLGFSVIIFVHELGHFLAAKWVGVRVDRFAVGFGYRLFGYRRGEGLTLGNRPNYRADELAEKGYGETDYCFKALPVGGYVKMLGQDDIDFDDKTGEVRMSKDPRAFVNRPVGHRMIVVSAGVVFNVIFACALLTAVFLVGVQKTAPVVGMVDPMGPAAGKLFPGDRVLAVNGEHVSTFEDFIVSVLLSDGPIRVRVERNGQTPDDIIVEPEFRSDVRARVLQIMPQVTTRLAKDGAPVPGLEPLRKGDEIVAVIRDGKRVPIGTAHEYLFASMYSAGRPLELIVKRPNASGGGSTETSAFQRPAMTWMPPLPRDGRESTAHLLGMVRRPIVEDVVAGDPGERGGLKPRDVIAAWGPLSSPTNAELIDYIRGSPGVAARVTVERDGSPVDLEVTPQRPFKLWGKSVGRVGVQFGRGETARPVIADVVPGTPAAALNIPRDSLILAVDGREVKDWIDVLNTLLESVGKTVTLKYRTGQDEVEARLAVPENIVTTLALAPTTRIMTIDGRDGATVQLSAGKERKISLPNPQAIEALLAESVGKTVKVRYVDLLDYRMQEHEREFTVTAANADPWPARVQFLGDDHHFLPLTELVHANGNPLTAFAMGMKVVRDEVVRVYQFISQLSQQKMSTENVAGPVGIFSVAIEQAKTGLAELLFFLAFISINLAVINFLPLPVMDGGLMVFLLIEKLKGKPLSIRTQMISTLVGLAVILVCAVLVTIQDIGRFFN